MKKLIMYEKMKQVYEAKRKEIGSTEMTFSNALRITSILEALEASIMLKDVLKESDIVIIDSLEAGSIQEAADIRNLNKPFPNDNFFIEVNIKDGQAANLKSLGIHVYDSYYTAHGPINKNKLKEYTITAQAEIIMDGKIHEEIFSIVVVPSMLPRFFSICQKFGLNGTNCGERFNPTNCVTINDICLNSQNTTHRCGNATIHLQILRYITYVVYQFNAKKKLVPSQPRKSKMSVSSIHRVYSGNHVIIITPEYRKSSTPLGNKGKPKGPHPRRGHPRRYRDQDGNIIREIWIDKTFIHKEKANSIEHNKIYKIVNRRKNNESKGL